MTIANIKISQLQDIGGNLTHQSLFPIDDLNASPITTKKGNLQLVGNYILSQAGGSNFVQAAQATLAQSVVNAAQPNITSVGTLTSLEVSGNLSVSIDNLKISGGINGYVLQTDGTGNLSWTAQSGNGVPGGSNTQVQFNDAGNFAGNSGFAYDKITGALTSPKVGTNIVYNLDGIAVDNSDLESGATAAIVLPDNGNTSAPVQIYNSYGNITLVAGEDPGILNNWYFNADGNFISPGNADFNGNVITIGPGAIELASTLSNSTLVISDTGTAHVQAAIYNVSDVGSADWAAYGHHGDNMGGWTDVGFTSSFFDDPNYTITGPGDGYLISLGYRDGQAPAIGGGNLILATGYEGTTKDIIFGTGGFAIENEFARIEHANNLLHLTRENAGIAATGNITANYLISNIGANINGDVVLQGNALLGNTYGESGNNIGLQPGVDGYAIVNSNDQRQYIQIDNDAIYIGTDYPTNNFNWTFGATGNLTTPGNITVNEKQAFWAYSSTGLTVTANIQNDINGVSMEDGIDTYAYANANVVIQSNTGNAGNVYGWTFDNTGNVVASGNMQLVSNENVWNFDTDGTLTLPGNTMQLGLISGNTVIQNLNDANIKINASGNVWSFGTDGNITFPDTSQQNTAWTGTVDGANVSGTVANAEYANTAGTVTATGNIDANNFYINNLATPMDIADAATKGYVDSAATGLHIHDPVAAATVEDLATTTGGTITYDNGASGIGATLTIADGTLTIIDTVPLTTNMRLMIKNEANGVWNGIYVYNSSTLLTRSTDFDDEVQAAGGDYFFVDAGYVNGKTSWVQVTQEVVVGVDPMNFIQFSAAGSYNAGTGLTLTGSTFSVNSSQSQITSVGTLSSLTVSGQITSTLSTGTAPLAVTSTTKVANLNVEQVDGYHADINNNANTIIVRDANGNIYANSYFGDGGHLSNINGANVTGTAANANYSTYSGTASSANSVAVGNVSGIGNIATLNLDGNASNILYGNGTFAAVPVSYGNGNVATFLSNYGSNTITTTGNVQVGNIIGNGQALTGLNGANVTGAVSYATVANSVAVGNVSGIGNIATINLTGSTSNVLYGNGTFAPSYGNSNVQTLLASFGSNNITTTGNITGNTAGFAIGYRDIPQLSFTGNTTLALTDAGKHYYSTLSTANTLTVPNNNSISFATGTAINVINQGTGNITIAQGSGVTMYLAGNSTSGNRTLASYGVCTLQKVATDTWFIVGVGVS